MKVLKVLKNGGANMVTVYMELSVSIRLNSRFFILTFQGLSNSNAITW